LRVDRLCGFGRRFNCGGFQHCFRGQFDGRRNFDFRRRFDRRFLYDCSTARDNYFTAEECTATRRDEPISLPSSNVIRFLEEIQNSLDDRRI
jgi:hypothetical protein